MQPSSAATQVKPCLMQPKGHDCSTKQCWFISTHILHQRARLLCFTTIFRSWRQKLPVINNTRTV